MKEPLIKGGQGHSAADMRLSAIVLAVCIIGAVAVALALIMEAVSNG